MLHAVKTMTTDVKTSEKILTYDGDCPMCLATVGMLLKLGLVRPEQTRANYDLVGAEQELARAAGIRNQLVVFDAETHETRVGSDGLLWIIRDHTRFPTLVGLLGLPGVRQLVRFGYEAISYNRRIVSPPRHQIVCDCEPEVTVGRRLTLIVPLVAAWCVLALVWSGSTTGLIVAAAPWVILALAALVVLPGMLKIDYLGHLAVTMFTGALLLVPAILLMRVLPGAAYATINAVALVGGFGLMFAMQRKRVAALKLSRAWLWAWVLLVAAATAAAIVSHFRGLLE
jgi:predicted DCC family thiol-disulfide oxidoreductase YuxK